MSGFSLTPIAAGGAPLCASAAGSAILYDRITLKFLAASLQDSRPGRRSMFPAG